jgi:hypothetical protein
MMLDFRLDGWICWLRTDRLVHVGAGWSDPHGVHMGGRVALGNSLLVEVGGFKLGSILLGLLDTADAWRSMKDI